MAKAATDRLRTIGRLQQVICVTSPVPARSVMNRTTVTKPNAILSTGSFAVRVLKAAVPTRIAKTATVMKTFSSSRVALRYFVFF